MVMEADRPAGGVASTGEEQPESRGASKDTISSSCGGPGYRRGRTASHLRGAWQPQPSCSEWGECEEACVGTTRIATALELRDEYAMSGWKAGV